MNKNIKLIINYLLGPLLFVLLTWSLYRQIIQQPDLEERWKHIKTSWLDYRFWVVFLLMFVNWLIEAGKWKILITPLQKISLLRSFKAIMAGCSITMLTPNRIGEYGGRILFLEEASRLRAISLTILGSISQLVITMLMGTAGLFILRSGVFTRAEDFSSIPWLLSNTLLSLSLFVTVILLLIYFRARLLTGIISKLGFMKKLVDHIAVMDVLGGKQLLRILFLSFFRYMVFILQYMLLLEVMEVDIGFPVSFLLLSGFYLVMLIAPTIGFTELPVRATASVVLLKVFSSNIIGIQAAALGIWLINLVLPAIIGSVMILGIKIMKER